MELAGGPLEKGSGPLVAAFVSTRAALLLAGLACLANPRWVGIIGYVATLSGNAVVQGLVTEWAPPSLDTQAGALFIIAFILGVMILIFSPRRPTFFQISTFLLFSLLAFKTLRGAVWFGLAMAPIYANHLAAIARQLRPAGSGAERRPGHQGIKVDTQPSSLSINLAFLMIMVVMALISLPWMRPLLPLPGAKSDIISIETPVAATEYLLSARPAGNLFHEMGFGSYLIWAAQPEYKVFVDPRIELFSRQIWEDYIIITNALPGWEEYLKRYGVRTLLLSPKEQGKLIDAVGASDNWQEIYQDRAAVIYTHK